MRVLEAPRHRDRIVVTTAAVAALITTVWQTRAALTRDFTSLTAYASLGCAAYAALLASVLIWVAPRRPDTRTAAFMLVLLAIFLSLILVPSRSASFVHQLVFAISYTWVALLVRFAAVFPSHLTAAEIESLRGITRQTGVSGMLRDRVLGAQVFTLSHARVLGLSALCVFLSWTFIHTLWFASASYLIAPAAPADLPWWYLLMESVLLAAVALGLSFLWTGYHLADEQKRQRVLIVVLCWTIAAFWGLMGIMIAILPLPGYVRPLTPYFWTVFYPIAWLAIVTGMGAGALYSGAFDIRPLISKTTVYGALVLSLTFLFAIVEELVQALLANRLGLPDGIGTVAAAVVIATALGPLRTRLERLLERADGPQPASQHVEMTETR